jgi:hypothetical protein
MSPAAEIKADPLLFDKLLLPLEPLLTELDADPRSQAAEKLRFRLFVRVLLFRLFALIKSLRDLVLDLKSKPEMETLGFPSLGLSTVHDAFARFPLAWFVQLTQHLLQTCVLQPLPELAALGQLWCVDSSWWPIVRQLGWLSAQGFTGVRLHLGLSLNTLCPAAFLLSYDQSSTSNERTSLRALA